MIEVRRNAALLAAVPVILLGGFVVRYVLAVVAAKRRYRHIVGPEPEGVFGFLFGNVGMIIEEEAKGVTVPEIFINEMAKYKTRIMKFRCFSRTSIIITDPRLVKEILIDQNCLKYINTYEKLGFPGGMRFMGNGLVTECDHEKWRQQRAIYNPGFHKKALMQFMKEFNDKGDILMRHLRNIAETQPERSISLLEKFNHTALDVIASVAFSMNVDSVNDPTNEFHKNIYASLDGIKYFFYDPLMKYQPYKWPFLYRYNKVLKYLRNLGERQIRARLEMAKKGEPLPDDILTMILQSNDAELSIESMVDEFVTLFFAGQETTANTLASAFLELGRNPDALAKLRSEIDEVLGSKPQIEYDDLHKLRYTGCVFKEALRLYPAVPNLGRANHEDLKLDGITIPKGSWITVSSMISGRDPEWFPEPLKFNPDRFLDENSIKNYTYFPFSMGPRNCIGQNFAQIEGKFLIAKFIQNFDFELDPNQTFSMYMALTLRPKDGTKCFIRLRK